MVGQVKVAYLDRRIVRTSPSPQSPAQITDSMASLFPGARNPSRL